MWGLIVGLAIGVLQVLALKYLGRMILGEKTSSKFLGALLILLKIALIVLVLVLIAKVSLTHLLYTAGGMLAGIIAALVIMLLHKAPQKKAAGCNADGKDGSNG